MIVLIFCVILLALVLWMIGISNRINKLKVQIDEAKSDISVYLRRRYDVIQNSLKVVKEYTKHENEVFDRLIRVREGMSLEELEQVEEGQTKAIRSLFAVGEAYPELKSEHLYVTLQQQLSDENAHYAASKRMFNANVSAYNQYIVQFPASVIANMMGHHQIAFLPEEDESQLSGDVEF